MATDSARRGRRAVTVIWTRLPGFGSKLPEGCGGGKTGGGGCRAFIVEPSSRASFLDGSVADCFANQGHRVVTWSRMQVELFDRRDAAESANAIFEYLKIEPPRRQSALGILSTRSGRRSVATSDSGMTSLSRLQASEGSSASNHPRAVQRVPATCGAPDCGFENGRWSGGRCLQQPQPW